MLLGYIFFYVDFLGAILDSSFTFSKPKSVTWRMLLLLCRPWRVSRIYIETLCYPLR